MRKLPSYSVVKIAFQGALLLIGLILSAAIAIIEFSTMFEDATSFPERVGILFEWIASNDPSYVTFLGTWLVLIALVWFCWDVFGEKMPEDRQALLAELEASNTRFSKLVENSPKPEFHFYKDELEWWLEIRNEINDAEFAAKIDFTKTKYRAVNHSTRTALWDRGVCGEPRFIPNGARERIFVYSVDNSQGLYQTVFKYVEDGKPVLMKGVYSWTDMSDPPTPVHDSDKGIVSIIVTSKPPMIGGTKKFEFEYDGFEVFSLSDSVIVE